MGLGGRQPANKDQAAKNKADVRAKVARAGLTKAVNTAAAAKVAQRRNNAGNN